MTPKFSKQQLIHITQIILNSNIEVLQLVKSPNNKNLTISQESLKKNKEHAYNASLIATYILKCILNSLWSLLHNNQQPPTHTQQYNYPFIELNNWTEKYIEECPDTFPNTLQIATQWVNQNFS